MAATVNPGESFIPRNPKTKLGKFMKSKRQNPEPESQICRNEGVGPFFITANFDETREISHLLS